MLDKKLDTLLETALAPRVVRRPRSKLMAAANRFCTLAQITRQRPMPVPMLLATLKLGAIERFMAASMNSTVQHDSPRPFSNVA